MVNQERSSDLSRAATELSALHVSLVLVTLTWGAYRILQFLGKL